MAKGLSRDSIDKDTKGSPRVLIFIIAVIIILVVALGIFVSGKTGQPVSVTTTPPTLLETAQDQYTDGKYDQAIELLEAYIDGAEPTDRDLPLAKDLLVSCYWQIEDHEKAFALLSEIAEADSSDIDSVYRLGLLASELEKNDLAADYFSQAVAARSGQPQYHTGYAETLTTLGKHEEARDQWRIVMSLTPLDSPYRATLHGHIGDTYVAQDIREAARAEFQAGLGIEPDDQHLSDQLKALGP